MKKILLTVAIPSYNRCAFLKKNLPLLYSQMNDDVQILICDNASSDGTDEFIKEKYPKIKYIKHEKNIGANNNFVECYRNSDGEYVLLLGSDDSITEDAINHILGYLKKHNGLPVVFLNHVFYEGDYNNIESCKYIYFNNVNDEDQVLRDKKSFMQIAKARITFISSYILKKSFFDKVQNPDIYVDTSFIHTCILFESTGDREYQFGFIKYPCIAANITKGDAGLESNYSKMLEVFGKKMKNVMCDISSRFGYNPKQMKKIYIHEASHYLSRIIIDMKLAKDRRLKDDFRENVFPWLKEFPRAWVTVFLIYVFPVCITKNIETVYKGILRKR